MIGQLLHIFFLIVFIYLALSTAFILFLSIAGSITVTTGKSTSATLGRFAILIPTYKEDAVIETTIRSASEHDYPPDKFDVYVAADQLKQSTLDKLQNYRIYLHEVFFERGSKAKSLNFLLNKIDDTKYDYALILDGDNIMSNGFLNSLNEHLQTAGTAVQGHRTAKNTNTPIAILDALSEEVNNHLFRKGPSVLGLSSSLIGSGMAFPFRILKQIYNKPGIIDNPACDREVDFELLVHGVKVAYLDSAFVFDEKVSARAVYQNQRRRWLESQVMHVILFFSDWKRVPRKSADFWNKLFIQLVPPRIFMLALFLLVFACLIFEALFNINITGISPLYWSVLFIAYIAAILIAIPARLRSADTLRAFLHLPILLAAFLRAAFSLKRRRKEFAHTPKTFTGSSASTKAEE